MLLAPIRRNCGGACKGRDAARRASSLPEMPGRGAAASGKKRPHAETDGSKQTKLEMWFQKSYARQCPQ